MTDVGKRRGLVLLGEDAGLAAEGLGRGRWGRARAGQHPG
jgi:hypothetical protein